MATTMRYVTGGLRYAVILSRDITAEKEREEERARLRAVLDAPPDAVIVADATTGRFMGNRAVGGVLGSAHFEAGLLLDGASAFDLFRTRRPDGTPMPDTEMPLTIEHHEAHLAGRESLGGYPLRDDGTCPFFAIDFDRAIPNLSQAESDRQALDPAAAVAETLREFGFNHGLDAELSKSKGAHLWGFLDGPVLAYDIRHSVQAACAAAKITKYELFLKQDTVPRGGVGNYVNLPYFGRDERPPLPPSVSSEEVVGNVVPCRP